MVCVNWEVEHLLRSTEMGPLLAAALGSSGLELQEWALERVYSRPPAADDGLRTGHSMQTSARFRVQASGHVLTLVSSTRELSRSEREQLGAVRCESEVGLLHIWAHPTDPELPGLAVVEDHGDLARRLSGLLEIPVSIREAELLVLRPLRRAVYRTVLESDLGFRTVFLKVVRPKKVAELRERYSTCSLTPPSADLGEGILVADQAAGRSLAEHLYRPPAAESAAEQSAGTEAPVVEPNVVLSALESIGTSALQQPPRTAPAQRLASFTSAVLASGAERGRVADLTRRIEAGLNHPPGPLVPVHGDFHPANLFLAEDASRPTALIDADTVGPGYRSDDLAMMLAHLLVLPSYDAAGYAAVPAFLNALWNTIAARHQATDLPARTAAAMLSLAPGARSPSQLNAFLTAAESLLDTEGIGLDRHPGPQEV